MTESFQSKVAYTTLYDMWFFQCLLFEQLDQSKDTYTEYYNIFFRPWQVLIPKKSNFSKKVRSKYELKCKFIINIKQYYTVSAAFRLRVFPNERHKT